MNVTVREKKLTNGKKSLYLDFYPPIIKPDTGKPTRREFLGLYIHEKPRTETEREHNKETKKLAEKVCAKRLLEVQAGNYGFLTKTQKKADFLEYFRQVADKRSSSKSAKQTWDNTYLHFVDFCGDSCTFEQLTKEFVEGFRAHLLTCHSRRSKLRTLRQNTASSYFLNFCAVLKEAVEDKLLLENPAAKVSQIKTTDSIREYLTIDELHRLAKTTIRMPDNLRRAALFSALTGLRFSDIQNLKWENLHHSKELGYYLQFKTQKTGENQTLPISDEARELMLETGNPNDEVFSELIYSSMVSVFIGRWTVAAGISKTITFHSFRHTYATAQLTLGTDLYTVSKMLGHKSISKTQIYAKIIDEKKRDAANKISLK
jgi:integrase